MSDIERIRRLEQEQLDLLEQEREKARERISRAEADASFRVGQALKECKAIVDDIVQKGAEDASKEVAFIREQEADKGKGILEQETQRVDAAVEHVMKQIVK